MQRQAGKHRQRQLVAQRAKRQHPERETPVTSGDKPTSSATLGGEVPATSASGAAGETPTSGTDTPATSGNNSTTSVTPGGEVPATSASGSASETPNIRNGYAVTSGDKPTSSATLGGEAPATSASGAAGETPTSGTDTPVTSGDKPTSSCNARRGKHQPRQLVAQRAKRQHPERIRR